MNRAEIFEAFRYCITEPGCAGCPREETCRNASWGHHEVGIDKILAMDVLNVLKEDEKMFMKHYEQGRHDEAGIRDGTIMQTFSPD